jgi:flagellar hook-basal body complex protein FliE
MAGLLDKLKGLVKERETQIRTAVDKAGDFVDDKTKGKYHDKIAKAGEKADQAIDKVTDKQAAAAEGTETAATTESAEATDTASAATEPTSEAAATEAEKPADEAKPDQPA